MPEPQIRFSENALAALAALSRCTAAEINAIERHHLPELKRELATRKPADAEVWDMEDRVTLGDAADLPFGDGTAGEVDEDGDEVLDPTPTEEEVRRALLFGKQWGE